MFLKLNHKQLEVYKASLNYVVECYRFCTQLPTEEKCGMISQIKRAALSVHLKIAEGASRKSPTERKRFYEISRSSMVENDAAIDVADKLGFLKNRELKELEDSTVHCFKLLCGLIR